MSKIDLKKYKALTAALQEERNQLQERLAKINEVLGEGHPERGNSPARRLGSRNSVSLRKAVISAVNGNPMAKQDILEAVQKAGYRFNTSNPMNSLNVVLYGSKNPKFRNEGGMFSV